MIKITKHVSVPRKKYFFQIDEFIYLAFITSHLNMIFKLSTCLIKFYEFSTLIYNIDI